MTDNSNDGIERRKSFRLDMEKEVVDISWVDSDNKQCMKKIACLDFARGGLRLDCDHPLPVDAKVIVQFRSVENNSQKLNTSVLRCEQQKNGWYEVALLLERDE